MGTAGEPRAVGARVWIAVAVLGLAPTPLAHAATLHVPADYSTIPAAISAASDGDRIEVAAGSYACESGVRLGVDVELVGAGAATTTLVGEDGPAVRVTARAEVTVSGFSLGSEDAEVVRVSGRSVANFVDVVVSGGRGFEGSGMAVDGSSEVGLTRVRFEDNDAEGAKGGHLAVSGSSTVTAADSTFTTGAAGEGAAVYVKEATFVATGCSFSDNSTSNDGGAIRAEDSTITLTSCAFSDNRSDHHGGDLCADSGSTVTIADTRFTDGYAAQDGGSLHLLTADSSLAGTSFIRGSSGDNGAHVYVKDAELVVDGSTFTGGYAGEDGGSLYADTATLTISAATFAGNEAVWWGGALFATGASTVAIADSQLVGNEATSGGAILASSIDSLSVQTALLCDNLARLGSGGALWASTVGSTVELSNDLFVENDAFFTGGAVHLETLSADVLQNHFLANDGGMGGAGYLDGVDLTFTNNLVAWTAGGDGLYLRDGSQDLAYGDWWDNTSTHLDGDLDDDDLDGTHLFEDPLLVDYVEDGSCVGDDYRPDTGSPLIDAGHPDLEDPDGSRSDIGAFGGALAPDNDWDDDGWEADEDCDDTNPEVYPGATEVCDEDDTDEDCDDLADDDDEDVTGQTTWYLDDDEDGFGDEDDVGALWCDPPTGLVDNALDCDDTTEAISPDATEECDELDTDEDCDDLVDDADEDVTGQTLWYLDDDEDGYGDADDDGALWCDPPSGLVDNADDCDDSTDAISPDDPEVCDPLDTDEDCDGLVDDADPDATGTITRYLDVDGDGFGDPEAPVQVCDAGEGEVEDRTDCDDSDAQAYPGATEVPDDGVDQDCSGFDANLYLGGGAICGCGTPGGLPALWWAWLLVPVASRRRAGSGVR